MQLKNKPWVSTHIFHKNTIYSIESDRIILEVVKPFVEKYCDVKTVKKYFFIRYSHSGPHVRFRAQLNDKNRVDEFKFTISEFINKYYPWELKVESTNNFENDTIYKFIEYEPEVERYGGISGMKISEDYFYYSSRIVIKLLGLIKNGDKSERLGKGLFVMLMLLFVFTDSKEKALAIMANYSSGYLRLISRDKSRENYLKNIYQTGYEKQKNNLNELVINIWGALERGNEFDDEISEYYNMLLSIKKSLNKKVDEGILRQGENKFKNYDDILKIILPSYIHMMNNRMGISMPEEAYLATLINSVFQCQV